MPADGSGAITRPDETVIKDLIEELRATFGDRVSTSMAVREHHARDFSFHEQVPSMAMARSTSLRLISLQICKSSSRVSGWINSSTWKLPSPT